MRPSHRLSSKGCRLAVHLPDNTRFRPPHSKGEQEPQTKILPDKADIPTHWYNVVADMLNPPPPPLGPDGKPVGPEALTAIFPMNLIEQEVASER